MSHITSVLIGDTIKLLNVKEKHMMIIFQEAPA
jgi:hypothetical protein